MLLIDEAIVVLPTLYAVMNCGEAKACKKSKQHCKPDYCYDVFQLQKCQNKTKEEQNQEEMWGERCGDDVLRWLIFPDIPCRQMRQ